MFIYVLLQIGNRTFVTENNQNHLHPVFCTQQGRQREPSVKTLRSPLSAEFWSHCVLSGRTQRRAVSTPERRNGNINLSKYFISSSGDRTHNQLVLQSHCHSASAPRLASKIR